MVGENTFKFLFGSKADRDLIFNGRPWSLNGAHLIIKGWTPDIALERISFDWSTFMLQVHGLPPVCLHEGMVKMVGNKVERPHIK